MIDPGGRDKRACHGSTGTVLAASLSLLLTLVVFLAAVPSAGAAATGAISGTVTDASAKTPVDDALVCALGSAGGGCAHSGEKGEYTITSLPAGEYTVWFSSSANYITQYYDGKSSASEATPVPVAAATTTSGINAALQVGGQIHGKVTAGKLGVTDELVCAAAKDGAGGCALTTSGGEYTVNGLPTGEYTVVFTSAANYLTQYYDEKAAASEATPVPVTAGSMTSAINASLKPGGQIHGKVTSASGGEGLGSVLVCATPAEGVGNCAVSDESGQYTIPRLLTGSYTVRFSTTANYLPQYYDGKANASEATPVAVKVGSTTDSIDAALQPGGQISGKVTSATDDAALAGALVCATGGQGSSCALTNESGEYTVQGLQTGEYTVVFSSSGYVTQYYDERASASEATKVSVTAGVMTLRIDASLQPTGEIAGSVSDASSHASISGALVCATGEPGTRCALSNESGEYTISGLAAGEYTVKFSAANFVAQYYDGKANASEATPVAVSEGHSTAGIDAALQLGGEITGAVTDATSKAPVAGALVCASGVAGGGCAVSSEKGEYTISGLPSGEYTVKFSSSANYVTQYYDDKASASEATAVSVSAGASTGKIDAAMQRGGRITGTVTDASTKDPVAGVLVCATESSASGAGCGVSGENGAYTIQGLPSGEYTVKFTSSANYAPQYYEDKASASEAKLVSVAAGATTPEIEAALQTGAQISGEVSEGAGKTPVADALVCASGSAGGNCALSNEEGEYTIIGLAGGKYTVKFSAPGYLAQYYDGVETEPEATQVSVKLGAITKNIAAVLKPNPSEVKVEVEMLERLSGESTYGKGPLTAKAPATVEYEVVVTNTGKAPVSVESISDLQVPGCATSKPKHPEVSPGERDVPEVTCSHTLSSEGETFKNDAGVQAAGSEERTREVEAKALSTPKFEVQALERISGQAGYLAGPLTGPAPMTVEYEILVSNTGTLPVSVEEVADAQVPGCATASPKQGEVKAGEKAVVEATCSHTLAGGGEKFKNAAIVRASGEEQRSQELEARTEVEPKFEAQTVEQTASQPGFGSGPLTGKAPMTVEYEVLVSNTGAVPVTVEEITDPQVPGCATTSPTHAEVKVDEARVLEATCSHTIVGEGESFANAAIVKASGKEQQAGEVHAATESREHFSVEELQRNAAGGSFSSGQLIGAAPLTVDYEILVSNNGSVTLNLTSIRDTAVPGCETAPEQPQVPVGAKDVLEATCSHTLGAAGEAFTNAVVVTSAGKHEALAEVEALTEEAAITHTTSEEHTGPSTGPPSGGGEVLGSQTAGPSSAEITALLERLLTPPAKAAKIGALLKAGSLSESVRALEAGTLTITWYELPKGAKLARASHAKPVVVASGRVAFAAAASAKMKIKLTSAGRSLLKHAKHLKLTARATFAPSSAASVSATATFSLG